MEVEYKNIDPKLVVNEIRNGRSIEAVQKLFGLRFKSEVMDLYTRGLMELGEIPPVDFTKKKQRSTNRETTQQTPAPATRANVQPVDEPEVVYVEPSKSIVSTPSVMPSNPSAKLEPAVTKATVTSEKTEKPVVIRRRERKPNVYIKTNNFRTIGQSGSITLNKALLIDQLGFSIGDTFEICREDDRIVLQKIDNAPI